MVVVVGKPETAESVRELNFRGEFEVCEIVERSIPVIQRQLEQNGDQISHLVYDVRIIGNIDQSLGLLERICVTVPGIKIIVVTEGLSTDSAFMRDILTLVPAEQIVSDHGAELKRVLNTMLCDAGLISEDTVQNDTSSLEEPTPPGETAQAPPATSEVVTPPSQIDRETARSHLVLPKPRLRGRNATTIAVCGAGHRIGTTTQAMQLCLYVKAMGYKAAVIEMSVSSLTPYTQISDEVVLFDEKHFRIEGTDIYNDKTCILATKTKYDYLILDYGVTVTQVGITNTDSFTPSEDYTGGITGSGNGTFIIPLASYSYISCHFGEPDGWTGAPHGGMDFAAGYGTPIYAAADGVVVKAGYHNSWGNYVKIYHGVVDGNQIYTLYAHCSSLGVSAGQTVTQGQTIAAVGSTGDSTGNHLHFEVYVNNTRVAPENWL